MKKNKKKNSKTIDLRERQNIQIIKAEDTQVTDDELENFKRQLKAREQIVEDFCRDYIEEQIKQKNDISPSEFESIMKKILKEHKLLKIMIQGQEE